MAWSYTYDTATPDGSTDSPREGDDRIKEIKSAVQERMDVDHDWGLTGTEVDDNATCHHKQVIFVAPLADVTLAASEGGLFTKDVSDKAELHYKDEDANTIQLTTAGAILLSGEYNQELNLSNTGNTIMGDVIACTAAGYLTLPTDGSDETDGNLRLDTGNDWLEWYDGDATAWKTLLDSAMQAAKIDIGTYAGDAAATQAITGIGFQPDAVMIIPLKDNRDVFIKTADMGTTYAKSLAGRASDYLDDSIISLDADGFTVGDGSGGGVPDTDNLNEDDPTTYAYIALKMW